MKRILILCLCLGLTNRAYAALALGCTTVASCDAGQEMICEPRDGCEWEVCYCSAELVLPGLCTTTNCTSDTSYTDYSTGYTVKRTRECLDDICTVTASEYACASGYYGTATSDSTGCTICPDNATCLGGNGSTFRCAQGYYKNGASCPRCPISNNTYGTTLLLNATSITDCYLPSGTEFSDTTGTGTYTDKCYYTE
ncbi:MAG: hypothetical protein IJX89_00265 [Alphaproteobacteria bacterium]|nr:hypothetical protein [Alphaproteobacteria bacterium]